MADSPQDLSTLEIMDYDAGPYTAIDSVVNTGTAAASEFSYLETESASGWYFEDTPRYSEAKLDAKLLELAESYNGGAITGGWEFEASTEAVAALHALFAAAAPASETAISPSSTPLGSTKTLYGWRSRFYPDASARAEAALTEIAGLTGSVSVSELETPPSARTAYIIVPD